MASVGLSPGQCGWLVPKRSELWIIATEIQWEVQVGVFHHEFDEQALLARLGNSMRRTWPTL